MSALGLFEGFGVELEYMLVERETLDVAPVTDRVLREVCGAYEAEIEQGELNWSNELVLHVIELKTAGPARTLEGLAEVFQRDARRIDEIASHFGCRLMPTAMHPWMDPHTQTRLWPHEYNAVYEAFNHIFDCRGHGWSNLQSAHLNLPFADDEQFGRLHAAIRLTLPLLPALAASSPIVDGKVSGVMDARLEAYRGNSARIPSLSGALVPEAVFTRAAYESRILERIYADLAPHDPDGVLRYEWANARGAIARFDRNTIEIRVLDTQECPAADLAILRLIVATLEALVAQRWSSTAAQQAAPVDGLAALLHACIRDAEQAAIADAGFLRHFGVAAPQITAGDLWRHLRAELLPSSGGGELDPLDVILEQGCLARRIQTAVADASARRLRDVYRALCDCLLHGRMFRV